MPDTLEMPYRPKIIGAKDPAPESKYLYRLGGGSCLAGDFMEAYDRITSYNVCYTKLLRCKRRNNGCHDARREGKNNARYYTLAVSQFLCIF